MPAVMTHEDMVYFFHFGKLQPLNFGISGITNRIVCYMQMIADTTELTVNSGLTVEIFSLRSIQALVL